MQSLSLRRELASDFDFLRQLFSAHRAQQFGALGWDNSQLAALLNGQFQAKRAHYAHAYPIADHFIVEQQGAAIGNISLALLSNEWRIVDIALAPSCCGQGIGSLLLRHILVNASSAQRRVSLHVALDNPAQRLYQRLGFVADACDGASWHMIWHPQPTNENQA